MVSKTTAMNQDDAAYEKEDARLGYQAAIDLWIFSGDVLWSRFNSLLTSNSVILALMGVALTSDSTSHIREVIVIALGILGLGLCLVWTMVVARGVEFQKYYTLSARELEEKYFKPSIRTVSRGADLAAGRKTTLYIGDRNEHIQLKRGFAFGGSGAAPYLVIGLFALVYLMFLVSPFF